MKKLFSYFMILSISFCFIQLHSQLTWQSDSQKRNPDELYVITQIDKDIIKLKHKYFGTEKFVNIADQGSYQKNESLDMQIFDLLNADTNLYNNKYTYHDRILVGGGIGYPLVFGDFNNNNKLDIAGCYKIPQNLNLCEIGIIEQQTDLSFNLEKIYPDSVVIALAATDVDNDGFNELNFKKAGGQLFYNYESLTDSTYPDTLRFKHRMWQISGAVGSETFEHMDNDQIMDVIYVGDDSLPPSGQKIFVAEYDFIANNFIKRYSLRPPEWRISGISTGDFDDDGFKEFAIGSVDGDVYVFENTGNNIYDFVFSDTISSPNAYLNCATNDIDNNGRIEFFIGGSSFYAGTGGTKVYWFEASDDNMYTKKYIFFLLGTDVLGTTEMYSHDVNADGKDDLLFAFEGSIVILIWNNSLNIFELHYLDWLENWDQRIQSADIYDLYNSGKPDLIVSLLDLNRSPRIRSEIYKNNFLTDITNPPNTVKNFHLYQNYPNPFNAKTIINFSIDKPDKITLTIYDITGKEVNKLINDKKFSPGKHSISWNGKSKSGEEVSSGIYLYHLETNSDSITRKMCLIK